jgi:hypothetical protein
MKFVCTIRTDNAAFDDDRCAETARILRDVADQLEKNRPMRGEAKDANGNPVCKFAEINDDEI